MSNRDGEKRFHEALRRRRPPDPGGPLSAVIIHDLDKIMDIAQALQAIVLNRINRAIVESYSLEELDSLAFGLGCPPSTLEGKTINGRTRALLQHMLNRNQLADLIDRINDERPHLEF